MLSKSKEFNADSPVLTVDEVADYLRLSRLTVYKLAKRGAIPGFRVGSSWRFNRNFIERMMR
jgi:excisionase family DNA binding protein